MSAAARDGVVAASPWLTLRLLLLRRAVIVFSSLLVLSAHEHPNGQAVEVLAAVRRFIMAPRGGLTPESDARQAHFSGDDQLDRSVGRVLQWGRVLGRIGNVHQPSDCSELACARILTRKRSITTTRADANYQFQSIMNFKCCHGEIAGVDARCQSPLGRE